MFDDEDTPERRLWLAVLLTFFLDGAVLPHKFRKYLIIEARSEWAEYVCQMAGVEHPYFLRKLIAYFRANRPKRSKIVFTRLEDRGRLKCKSR